MLLFKIYNRKPSADSIKRLLIVKADGFGDHILFRNFLAEIKTSEIYKNHELHVVGSQVWQEFALAFDKQWVDQFIWIERNKFKLSFSYRLQILRQLNKYNYNVILYPSFVRETLIGDCIAGALYAPQKYASRGAIEYRAKLEDIITNLPYTKIFTRLGKYEFEFAQNKYVLEQFLGTELKTKQILAVDHKPNFLGNYILLFVGASDDSRKWSAQNFINLAQLLHHHYQVKIMLCGGSEDRNNYRNLDQLSWIINKIGLTTQVELTHLIANALCIVSNETVVPHLAMALEREVVVIYCGSNYKRFTNYHHKNYHLILHPQIAATEEKYLFASNQRGFKPYLDINQINVESVYKTVRFIIDEKNIH